MRKYLFLLGSAFFYANALLSENINWMTNYDQAVKASKESSKPLFVLFTGSDWCTWCIRLEQEALNTPEFAQVAGNRFIFLKLDFPTNHPLSPEMTAQNKSLQKQFGVAGFPSVILLDTQQKPIGKTGYRAGGGQAYGQHVLKMVEDHGAYKQKLGALDKRLLSGNELKDLYEYASNLNRDDEARYIATFGGESNQKHFFLLEHYRHLMESGAGHTELAHALRKRLEESDPGNIHHTQYQIAIIDFESICNKATDHKSLEKAVKILEEYLAKFGKDDKENAWRIHLLIAQIHLENGEYAEALHHVKSSYPISPNSAHQDIASVITNIEATKR